MCWDLSSDGDGDMQYLLDLDFVGFNDLSFDHEACWDLSGEGEIDMPNLLGLDFGRFDGLSFDCEMC